MLCNGIPQNTVRGDGIPNGIPLNTVRGDGIPNGIPLITVRGDDYSTVCPSSPNKRHAWQRRAYRRPAHIRSADADSDLLRRVTCWQEVLVYEYKVFSSSCHSARRIIVVQLSLLAGSTVVSVVVGGVAVHARIGVHACTCAPNMEHPQNVNFYIVPNWSIYQSGTLISLRFEDVALHDSCHAHGRVFCLFFQPCTVQHPAAVGAAEGGEFRDALARRFWRVRKKFGPQRPKRNRRHLEKDTRAQTHLRSSWHHLCASSTQPRVCACSGPRLRIRGTLSRVCGAGA